MIFIDFEIRRKVIFLNIEKILVICCVIRVGCWICGGCWIVTVCGWEEGVRMDGFWRSCFKVLVFIVGGVCCVFCFWSKLRRYWVVVFWFFVVMVIVWLELNILGFCFIWIWGWNTERIDCFCCWVVVFER